LLDFRRFANWWGYKVKRPKRDGHRKWGGGLASVGVAGALAAGALAAVAVALDKIAATAWGRLIPRRPRTP
jgi:hypothetical protein